MNTKKVTTLYYTKDQKEEYFTPFNYLSSHFILIPLKGSFIIVLIFYQYKEQTKLTIKTQTDSLTNNKSNFVMLFSFVGDDCSIP